MDNQVIYHGIVSIVDDAISILSRHAGEKFANSVTIRWNPRMRSTAGRAFLLEAKVELNPKLLHLDNDTQQSLSQVRQTLLHELAHLLAHHRHGHRIAAHGKEWKQACSDLGIPGESTTHQLNLPTRTQKKKWSYTCPHCAEIILRVRPMKHKSACYTCCKKYNNGKYHRRFSLIEQALDPN